MPSNEPRQDVMALKLALRRIRSKTVEVFCDYTGRPCVRFLAGRHPETHELRSSRSRSWIAGLYWEAKGRILIDREIDRVLNVLEHEAWKQDYHDLIDSKLSEAIEQEPILPAILEYMRDQLKSIKLMSKLLEELNALAVARRIPGKKSKKWPKTANALGVKLRLDKIRIVLRQLGIDVKIDHTRFGSKVALTNVTLQALRDDQGGTSSPELSPPNPNTKNNLNPDDGQADGKSNADLIAKLRQMKGEQS